MLWFQRLRGGKPSSSTTVLREPSHQGPPTQMAWFAFSSSDQEYHARNNGEYR
jgi:hypothetical protein